VTVAAGRSYGDPCGIARALDAVGERWALLVVRELVLGPKRFTDLRTGLPGASPNVLSQRLRELEAAGIVQRRRMARPAAVWVYELTERGHQLEPVLAELARWGSRTPAMRSAPLGVDALLFALRTTFDAGAAGAMSVRCGLRTAEEEYRIEVAGGRLHMSRGAAAPADAIIACDPAILRDLVFGRRRLSDAVREGSAVVEGDRQAAARFLRLFPAPQPAG
jgi:DNA-binding HxlR family transcriptional regulator